MNSPVNGVYSTVAVDDEMRIEKNAGLIMATNNSSIVSKRSVEKLYLPEPHFYRYFVKKAIRRSPTINRGYWLRMRAVDWIVRQFLEKPSEQGKVVINLGCGYDPIPFQWLARDPKLCANTKFIDVDYELLMQTKREVIRNTPKMNDLLHPSNADARGKDKSILMDSEEYAAIGCDLRNLPRLERLLRRVVETDNCLVLCVAEVSITYMQTVAADALIAWTSQLSSDVTFCLLEQCSPDQEDNPFTQTMVKHFSKLGTPLNSVFEYPGVHSQTQRFKEAGFTYVNCQNLWELWADPRFLSPSQRIALDYVEPFDEWEEFALFASHYCLVLAHSRNEPVLAEPRRPRRDSDAVHGGVGPSSRLATTAVCRPRHRRDEEPVVMPVEAGARCCHTITTLNNDENLLVGGRASPKQAFKDCWLQQGNVWKRVHDLPEPRYRHRVVSITLPDNSSGALLFGGKSNSCNVVSDILLWEPSTGWRAIRTERRDPVPRFGATFMRLGYNHGLLFGGLRQDGVVCAGLWRWRLITRNNTIVSIDFRASSALDATVGVYPWFARFGGSHSMLRDEVLIIGGIAKSGCIPKPYEILSIIGSFSNFAPEERELPLRITCVTPVRNADCPRPFLIGHSTYRTRSGLSVILGGGATCFSFGNYYNQGLWVLYYRGSGLSTDWVVVPSRALVMSGSKATETQKIMNGEQHSTFTDQIVVHREKEFRDTVRSSRPRILQGLDFGPCVKLWSVSYLRNRISPTREVTVHDAPGRTMNFLCKDFAYQTILFSDFLETLSTPSSHLYLRSLAAENPSSSPARFTTDWPEIASDFIMPEQLTSIEPNIHSSVLRISNDITMWLHYDVMANVLFQIKGIKKLALFPPEDLPKLKFPAGATTSELNLFNSKTSGKEYDMQIPPDTNPLIAILRPGDAIFIPPLWSHTGVSVPGEEYVNVDIRDPVILGTLYIDTSESNHAPPAFPSLAARMEQKLSSNLIHADATDFVVSGSTRAGNEGENPYINIAINVFFRNLPKSKYAAGRDVYGNRDLMAYEEGRRDVDKIVRRFITGGNGPEKTKKKAKAAAQEINTDVTGEATPEQVEIVNTDITLDDAPAEVTKAYLMRLSQELAQRAEAI